MNRAGAQDRDDDAAGSVLVALTGACAQRTAHAAVSDEKIRTAVLIAPIFTSRYLCAYM